MKFKIAVFAGLGCFVAVAAWFVHEPRSAQADEIPKKYLGTVNKGLEYLVKHQHKDGHWEGDDGKHPVAMTGLAGVALLMEGKWDFRRGEVPSLSERKHKAEIRKAADWLLDNARPDGPIFSGHPSETARYMQGHGLATIFLAGVFEIEYDPARRKRIHEVLTRAIGYIGKAQSSQGGWYCTSKAEGHDLDAISATVMQIQALQAAENVRFSVPAAAIKDAQQYLKAALGKYEKANAGKSSSQAADTAAMLVGRSGAIHLAADYESYGKWFKYCQAEIPVGRNIQFGRDEITLYYYAQAVFLFDRVLQNNLASWDDYRTALFDHLQNSQNKDGSWPCPPGSQEGFGVGPVHSAAVWCTILQLDQRGHPSMRRPPVARL